MARRIAISRTTGSLRRLPKDWGTAEYGSHWRLLAKLFKRFEIKRVLETGSGDYSTNLFLHRFGVELVSLENNPEWAVERGEGHELRLVEGPIAEALPPLADFDLVFIDDDPVEERPQTIKAVLTAPDCPLVVLHDYDHPAFGNLLRGLSLATETTRRPHTAVVWANDEQETHWLASA